MTSPDTQDTEELKPCDWCGKRPSIVCPDDSYGSAFITCGDQNDCPADVTVWVVLSDGQTIEDAKRIWNHRPDSSVTVMVEALDDLQQAEAEYRLMHDRHGEGSQAVGRAWDLMRNAGNRAREALTRISR